MHFKEKVTPKSFFLSFIANKRSAFPLTKVLASEVSAILTELASKEETLEHCRLWPGRVYVTSLCPTTLQLTLHPPKGQQNVFFPSEYLYHYLQCYPFGVWSVFGSKLYASRAAIISSGTRSSTACSEISWMEWRHENAARLQRCRILGLFGDEFHK